MDSIGATYWLLTGSLWTDCAIHKGLLVDPLLDPYGLHLGSLWTHYGIHYCLLVSSLWIP